MATPGTAVVMENGKRCVGADGKVLLFDADGDCNDCCIPEPCGGTFSFSNLCVGGNAPNCILAKFVSVQNCPGGDYGDGIDWLNGWHVLEHAYSDNSGGHQFHSYTECIADVLPGVYVHIMWMIWTYDGVPESALSLLQAGTTDTCLPTTPIDSNFFSKNIDITGLPYACNTMAFSGTNANLLGHCTSVRGYNGTGYIYGPDALD